MSQNLKSVQGYILFLIFAQTSMDLKEIHQGCSVAKAYRHGLLIEDQLCVCACVCVSVCVCVCVCVCLCVCMYWCPPWVYASLESGVYSGACCKVMLSPCTGNPTLVSTALCLYVHLDGTLKSHEDYI